MPADFDATFAKLREILRPYAKRMVVVHDTPENYYLDTKFLAPNGHPLFVGAVRRGRATSASTSSPFTCSPTC